LFLLLKKTSATGLAAPSDPMPPLEGNPCPCCGQKKIGPGGALRRPRGAIGRNNYVIVKF